ncbi:hypothetical protein AB0D14_17645 [Streptomyces sp. NPDC048484]|uniref:hypothetical protein n=1 Tax=Streptomyces sp. NPDC048484 TaxID=3155146 RepID=UPI0034286EAD
MSGASAARRPPPLPVRGAPTSSEGSQTGADRGTTGESGGAQPFALPMLSPEQLAADQPSIDMLRRVRRGLGALPGPD